MTIIIYLELIMLPPPNLTQITGSAVQEEPEADDDTSVQQRVPTSTGTALEGTSEMVDPAAGQNLID